MKFKQAKVEIKEKENYIVIMFGGDKIGIHYPLKLPCPTRDLFCRALDMPEKELDQHVRFMALYWSCYGDECIATNGRFFGTPNYQPYMLYLWHERNKLYLTAYNFGGSETKEDHWLTFDFEKERLYAIPKDQALMLLEYQYVDIAKPQTEDSGILWEGLIDNMEMIVEGFKKIEPSDIDQIKEDYDKFLLTLREWEQWLDNA